MKPHDLVLDIHHTTRKAIRALGYMPKRSKYRTLTYKLLSEKISATEYKRLQDRLRRFYKLEWEV